MQQRVNNNNKSLLNMLKIYIATTTGTRSMLVSNLPVLHVTLSVFMLKLYIIATTTGTMFYVGL